MSLHSSANKRDLSRTKLRFGSGFTLAEMLVTLSIVTIIFTSLLLGQSTYTDSVSVHNTADTLSAYLAQAQVYGVGVKEFAPGTNEFNDAYGVHFDITNANQKNAFIYFADRNANSQYDSGWTCPTGGSSECIEKKIFDTGNTVTAICSEDAGNIESCNLGGVDIMFKRPDPQALFTLYNSAGLPYSDSNLQGVRIKLTSLKGTLVSVYVYNTGQISIR